MHINKGIKFVIAICIGLTSWLLIKSVIKVWLHPIFNLPADSDVGSLFAASIPSFLVYRYLHRKN